MFLHLSVILFTGGSTWASTPPWAGTPLAGTPPGQYPPGHSACWNMVNKRAVRIPLECIIVVSHNFILLPYDVFENLIIDCWSHNKFVVVNPGYVSYRCHFKTDLTKPMSNQKLKNRHAEGKLFSIKYSHMEWCIFSKLHQTIHSRV